MLLTYFVFIAGFGLLVKGADWLVDGASSLAKKLGISTIVIGLTIVAFGTSMPEFIVNMAASFKGSAEIAIGNILGSNIFNIFFILGIAALIFPLTVKKSTVWKEIPFSLLAAITIGLTANDALIDKQNFSAITRVDGLILLFFFIIFIYYIVSISKVDAENNQPVKEFKLETSIFMVIGGLVLLVVGGKLIVDSAIVMAKNWGVSESLIGLTIVAVGTSLPELAASVVAAYKKNVDIAVGNIIGSNIFNIFWILGLSAIIKPLPFSPSLNTDILMTILASLLLFAFMFIGKKHTLERWQGAVFALIYVGYVTYLVQRG